MKYVLSLLVGLIAGVAVAAALLYFNPFTLSQDEPPASSGWVLRYSLAAEDTWLSTHDERLGLPRVPAGVPLLFEGGIRGSMLAAMPLDAAGGGASAAASRISVPSSASEFLRAGLIVDDYWLISVPGSGTVFVHAINNQWPLLRDTVVRVDWLKREFSGPGSYGPTQGPAATGAELVGLTGAYAGLTGRGSERLSLASYEGNLAQLSGQLLLDVGTAGR